jgi:hypothetical protein
VNSSVATPIHFPPVLLRATELLSLARFQFWLYQIQDKHRHKLWLSLLFFWPFCDIQSIQPALFNSSHFSAPDMTGTVLNGSVIPPHWSPTLYAFPLLIWLGQDILWMFKCNLSVSWIAVEWYSRHSQKNRQSYPYSIVFTWLQSDPAYRMKPIRDL